jgi:transposase
MPSIFVGIDVSQENLDVCRLPADQSFRVPNTPKGHRQLVERLRPLAAQPADIRIVLESTGGLELPVALALEQAGFAVAIIKPERARYFAKAHGQMAKTDAIDAGILALFCRDVAVPIIPLPPEELRHFRDLLDRRQQLVEMRTMESNRLATTTLKAACKSLDKHIAWIDREVRAIEADLDARVAANPQWAEIDRILQSIPGLGPQTARLLIGHLPELGQVNRKTIGHLVGVAPLANDSGTTEGLRHIVGGRRQVRNGLYMAALAACRHNPIAKALYHRLRERGKSAKVAIIAVAHKLLTIANAMVAQKTLWRHSTVAFST